MNQRIDRHMSKMVRLFAAGREIVTGIAMCSVMFSCSGCDGACSENVAAEVYQPLKYGHTLEKASPDSPYINTMTLTLRVTPAASVEPWYPLRLHRAEYEKTSENALPLYLEAAAELKEMRQRREAAMRESDAFRRLTASSDTSDANTSDDNAPKVILISPILTPKEWNL